MLENTICKFSDVKVNTDTIQATNFVYEADRKNENTFKYDAVYRVYYIVSGEGILHTKDKNYSLCHGDIFFTTPSFLYFLESTDDLKYMFISYVGLRGRFIMDQYSINKKNFVFHDYNCVGDVWVKNFMLADNNNLDMIAESTLLYTFSIISSRIKKENMDCEKKDIVLSVKKHIDSHYYEPELSLESISGKFSYNKKYISSRFKQKLNIGVSQYISSIRIQNACALMENGETTIKTVAFMCGFSDALYFSKVFKKYMKVSPKEFIDMQKR